MNRCDTFPILPEHLQQIAMLVSPLDIVSMAGVSFGWQRALCVPHFVSHVLVRHPTWPPWLRFFVKKNLVSLIGERAQWYNVLPVLEVASRGLYALRSLPGKALLVQGLVEYAIDCILFPTPGWSGMKIDSNYWIHVLNCQLWAAARNKVELMEKIWRRHIVSSLETKPFEAFLVWADSAAATFQDFKEKILDHCTNKHLDWNFLLQLTLLDPVFFPNACNLMYYLIEYPTTLEPGMVNVEIICRVMLIHYDNWSPRDAYDKGKERGALRPEEAWLWDIVLPVLASVNIW